MSESFTVLTADENKECVAKIEAALTHHYRNRSKGEQLIDILTDLRHWANTNDVDFQSCDDRAFGHYEDESG